MCGRCYNCPALAAIVVAAAVVEIVAIKIIIMIIIAVIVVITGLGFGDGPRTFAFFDSCVIIIKINIKIIIAAAGFVSFLQGFAADWFPQGPVFSSIRIPVR